MMRNIIVCVEGGKSRSGEREKKQEKRTLYWNEYKNTSSVKNSPSGGGGVRVGGAYRYFFEWP
jgi:hypothetical protein